MGRNLLVECRRGWLIVMVGHQYGSEAFLRWERFGDPKDVTPTLCISPPGMMWMVSGMLCASK